MDRNSSLQRLPLLGYELDHPESMFLTNTPCLQLDGRHVVFGKVIKGMEVVEEIEKVGTESGKPKNKVTITSSGTIQ